MPSIEELTSQDMEGNPTGVRGFQPFDPAAGMNAMEANKQAIAFARTRNGQRSVPVPTRLVRELRAKNRVWIYNVGPWKHTRCLGSLGDFIIPACPERGAYATIEREIPFDEPIIKDEHKMELREEAGFGGVEGAQYNAQQILGLGPFLSPANSLIQMGCFIGAQVGPNAKPAETELQAAHEALEAYYLQLVADARISAERGPRVAEAEITDKHHLAARKLNLDPKVELWMSRKMASANTRQSCPRCGDISDIGVVICKNCQYIFDPDRYLQIEQEQSAIRDKVKRGK